MIKCIAILKALPGQTHEEFKKRWIEGHAPIPLKNLKRMTKYVINVPNLDWHKQTGEGCLYDGIAELYWDSIEDMQADFNSPEGAEGSADGDKFLSCCINVYCEQYIIK